MTPPMYMRLKDLFVAGGLTAGFKVQWRQWRDTGKDTDQFIVFRPSGGTDITFDLGGDWYVMVDVISSKANPDAADAAVNAIVISPAAKRVCIPFRFCLFASVTPIAVS